MPDRRRGLPIGGRDRRLACDRLLILTVERWPGKVEAGVVTDEILTCVDWLPTLASMAGESARLPSDRPIDGVDASALLLGQSQTTGRDHVVVYGSDAQIQSIKWRTMKVVFRYSDTLNGPLVEKQLPMVFDLVDDPGEETDLVQTVMDCAWVLGPVSARIGALMQSMAQYPNIKPGEDFTGYARLE